MKPKNRFFHVITFLDVVGGVPLVAVDAPTFAEAVEMLRELDQIMCPDEVPTVDRQDCAHIVHPTMSVELRLGSLPQTDTIAVWHLDSEEDQIIRRREDGVLCWVGWDGTMTVVR